VKLSRCAVLLLLTVASVSSTARAQDAATATDRQPGQLSAQQSVDFEQAKQDFAAGKWAEALPILKDLHEHHPRNAEVAKYAAEAAINKGDYAYAETNLTPLVAVADEDWQAHILLARTYAQESKSSERDAELDKITKLHAATTDARFQRLNQFMVEQVATSKGSLQIVWSIVPYGGYKVYEMGRVLDPNGKRVFLISLESNDGEQPAWAQKHPQLAAAGQRFFSMDGYRDDTAANGQVTQTHFTFSFFEDGRPSYNTVRDRMVEIAEGKAHALSSRSGLPIPK
jgi:hypothetical protein